MNVFEANLAYGFDLGTAEGFLVNEVDDDGALTVSWFDANLTDEFPEQVYGQLYAAIPDAPAISDVDEREPAVRSHFGVKISFAGTFDTPRYILAIADSEMTAVHDEALTLDLGELCDPARTRSWDARLTEVLALLGLTLPQPEPRWLVFPFCD